MFFSWHATENDIFSNKTQQPTRERITRKKHRKLVAMCKLNWIAHDNRKKIEEKNMTRDKYKKRTYDEHTDDIHTNKQMVHKFFYIALIV